MAIINVPELSAPSCAECSEPWFVGKDVAEALGYGEGKSLPNAVANHVDDEDKGVIKMMTPGGEQNVTIINESGLYSLVLSSSPPSSRSSIAFLRGIPTAVLKYPLQGAALVAVRIQQL